MLLTPLSEEQQAIVQTAREFAATELAPNIAQWDRDAHFEPSVVKKLGELGFLGMLLPETYDGLGLDTLTYLLAMEEIAAVDASTAVLLSVHNTLPSQMIAAFGTEAQKTQYLKKLAHGELLGAFALSEPDAGSDAAALRCQARRDGDCWVLDGTKSWVTNGNVAGLIMVMARTDSPKERRGSRGISAFIVTPDMPGFRVSKKENKLGLRSSPTVQIVFDHMRLPADRLLGEEGRGFKYAMQSLEHGRLGIAAQAIGIARAACDASVAYAKERKQFGRPIADFQAIQHKLADMSSRVHASRALLHSAASAKDRGERVGAVASMVKLLASETAMWVTTQAIQVFGGYGYVKEYPVERYFRDAKVTEIYEGTNEIQRMVIARALLHA
ncbi:MAG TPA: acyl-CoA dehydrogenase [Gemmatimonadaceae bacterium]|nr:acyl-CoA dehydrogenase [Gemmatimonadaceae bacterium]